VGHRHNLRRARRRRILLHRVRNDVFSRAIGWQVLDTLKTELAMDALDMALWARKDFGKTGSMRHWCNHGDRGVHYTSIRYGQRLTDAGIERSVGSKVDSYDNALGSLSTLSIRTKYRSGRPLE
jgi:transposase InsO family protein